MFHSDGRGHAVVPPGEPRGGSSEATVTALPLVAPAVCSSTLRSLSIESVAELAAAASLAGIAWGSDHHVPVGDLVTAKRAAAVTADAGLRVVAYGSWFRLGVDDISDFGRVLETARAAGAPRVRVFAGGTGSAASTAEQRQAVVESTRTAATRAAEVGVELVFEVRPGTLTDGAAATGRLLAEVDRPNVLTFWAPPVGVSDASTLEGLDRLLPRVAAVHVFSWRPGHVRFPLSERPDLWRGVVDRVTTVGRMVDVFLEFVPNNDEVALLRESSTLRDHVARSARRVPRSLSAR